MINSMQRTAITLCHHSQRHVSKCHMDKKKFALMCIATWACDHWSFSCFVFSDFHVLFFHFHSAAIGEKQEPFLANETGMSS